MKSKKAKLQESVDFLRKQVGAGMINADKNQDLRACKMLEKRKRLCAS